MKKKWFCTFKHTEPLITAVKRDHFSACGKMPTAFNQNPQLILLKVFVIFKSVYGFVFRDFEDFIKQISVTQLFLRRMLCILNARVNWTLVNQIHFQRNFIFLETNQIQQNKTHREKKLPFVFGQCKINLDELINAEFMFTWKKMEERNN